MQLLVQCYSSILPSCWASHERHNIRRRLRCLVLKRKKDIFKTVRKLFILLETFQTVWKLSTLSGNFPDWLETFQTHLTTFLTLWKLSRFSRNIPDCQETFQTLRKLSRLLGSFPNFLDALKHSGRHAAEVFGTLIYTSSVLINWIACQVCAEEDPALIHHSGYNGCLHPHP